MRYSEIIGKLKEDATAGATASADVATVIQPIVDKKKKPVVAKRQPAKNK